MERKGHPDYIDFLMSDRFGLDWKAQPAQRVNRFIKIIEWESVRHNTEQDGHTPGKPKSGSNYWR